ncbi:MAG: hypothetical protein QMC80_02165 [Thermoplasmatales archaeon]|nr:hypothetical protein [Thermoplasmatales archaeon]
MEFLRFEKLDIIRVISCAFPEGFEYVTLLVGKDYFKLIGIDKSNTIACELLLDKDIFLGYNISSNYVLPVISKHLQNYLGLAKSALACGIPEENISVEMSLDRNGIDITISAIGRSVVKRRVQRSTEGIKKLPPLPNFEKFPSSILKDHRDLQYIFLSSADINVLSVSIEDGVAKFESDVPEIRGSFSLNGVGKGKATSKIIRGVLGEVSKISALRKVNTSDITARITVIDGGRINFVYNFVGGSVSYTVAPMISE